jgi:small subunit ribosomal protein S9|uniref:30S ribosomal protein S9 n=1 Tax=candidate division WOR-3 bacterium TaxID=2052148 RepID=A0A7C3YT57_UNCW3
MRESFFAVGSRKSAVAKVWLFPQGKGEIRINEKDAKEYLTRNDLYESVLAPFKVTGLLGQFDVQCSCAGGGLSAQTGAIALGIARALVSYNPDLRKTLKSAELLKRDPRKKERCKYGLAKRRKSFQWTKR